MIVNVKPVIIILTAFGLLCNSFLLYRITDSRARKESAAKYKHCKEEIMQLRIEHMKELKKLKQKGNFK